MIHFTEIDRAQAFRYMGMPGTPDENLLALADRCERKLLVSSVPNYVYRVCPLTSSETGIRCTGTALHLTGKDITAHLNGCTQAILLCATLSAGADAAIRSGSAADVLAGLVTDAMASALTEQLCDAAEQEILKQFPDSYPTWRFSPGYGDLPLSVQGDFLAALSAEKRLGVSVSAGGMLIPTKSVTAIIGLAPQPVPKGKRGCAVCRMAKTCQFRAKGVHCE